MPGRTEGQLPSLFNAGHLSSRPKLTYTHANWLILNPATPGRLARAFSAVVCVCCFILYVWACATAPVCRQRTKLRIYFFPTLATELGLLQ